MSWCLVGRSVGEGGGIGQCWGGVDQGSSAIGLVQRSGGGVGGLDDRRDEWFNNMSRAVHHRLALVRNGGGDALDDGPNLSVSGLLDISGCL